MGTTIVFFDGVCNLCNATVDFLIKRDKKQNLRFASLQSPAAVELLGANVSENLKSLVVVQDGRIYQQSQAIVQIGLSLGGIFAFLAKFYRLIPRPLRDALYRLLARNRYTLFGRRSTCRVPSESERSRFIDLY